MDFYDDDEYDNYDDEDDEVLPPPGESPESPDRVHDFKLGNDNLLISLLLNILIMLNHRYIRHNTSSTQILVFNTNTPTSWIFSLISECSFSPFIFTSRLSFHSLILLFFRSFYSFCSFHSFPAYNFICQLQIGILCT